MVFSHFAFRVGSKRWSVRRTEAEMTELIRHFAPEVVILDFVSKGFSVDSIVRLKAMGRIRVLALTDAQRGATLVNALRAGVTDMSRRTVTCRRSSRPCVRPTAVASSSIQIQNHQEGDQSGIARCGRTGLCRDQPQQARTGGHSVDCGRLHGPDFGEAVRESAYRDHAPCNILQKLGVNNTAAVVVYAVQAGLVSPNKFLFAREA